MSRAFAVVIDTSLTEFKLQLSTIPLDGTGDFEVPETGLDMFYQLVRCWGLPVFVTSPGTELPFVVLLQCPFYGSYSEADPVRIADEGVEQFRGDKYEVNVPIIVADKIMIPDSFL